MARVLVLHGPNLNMLGEREPAVYGVDTLQSINERLHAHADDASCSIACFQSNAEVELIEAVHTARGEGTEFIIINPAAFTHTSIALRDALAATRLPFVEVHLSNVHAREPFRHNSYFSDLAKGVICGLGALGYDAALQFALQHLSTTPPQSARD
ncbi:type II 3-dehydroquinate dehydratase [Congregibacter brevis]|uniref:3-dehydroquinate dehydratase n=1 Tax=Congregibacter brevis TaxID=3081201 RepID=A0ABZ0ICY3_9GAMM|nr:type II 3-dehydroquinate dehydratase [Congregibacter sp. IMCC45268]